MASEPNTTKLDPVVERVATHLHRGTYHETTEHHQFLDCPSKEWFIDRAVECVADLRASGFVITPKIMRARPTAEPIDTAAAFAEFRGRYPKLLAALHESEKRDEPIIAGFLAALKEAGRVIVPREPTAEMKQAGSDALFEPIWVATDGGELRESTQKSVDITTEEARKLWATMVEAAQTRA